MRFIRGILAGLLIMVGLGMGSSAAVAQGGERCFTETGQCISGAIRAYWEQNGGLAVFGFPTTTTAIENVEGQSLTVQWFERDRLEIQPDGRVTAGRLGARLLELQGTPWQMGPGEPGGNGCVAFAETGHRACGLFATYWQNNGGLERFGYPITGQFEVIIEGRPLSVQYFERRRMEYHPENAPPFDVLLGLLGNEVRAFGQEIIPPPAPPAPPPPSFNNCQADLNAPNAPNYP